LWDYLDTVERASRAGFWRENWPDLAGVFEICDVKERKTDADFGHALRNFPSFSYRYGAKVTKIDAKIQAARVEIDYDAPSLIR